MSRSISTAAFAVGLAAVLWVGAGYLGGSPLALIMTALICAAYLAGAAELRRFHQATTALDQALAALPAHLPDLGDWLGGLPPALQTPVRLRIEGERVALPGPALTPYLVGLLVLLGMLGTFLGMVVTLNGAVVALESTTDLHTIRAALAAPVKGLGVAFGTSVAGVAASAMLGLISTLCRRARAQTAQTLDARIATALRDHSLTHQRQQTFAAIQRQSQALPELVGKVEEMMARLERQHRETEERHHAEQARFYQDARGMYGDLAISVGASLQESLKASARLAGETIQPVVESTMSAVAREAATFQARLADTVQAQLDGVSTRFDATSARVADTWTAALARHELSSENLHRGLNEALASYTTTFEQRSAALLASVDSAHAGLRADLADTTSALTRDSAEQLTRLADTLSTQFDGVSARLDGAVVRVADTWSAALDHHQRGSEAVSAALRQSLQDFAETFEQRSAALLATVSESTTALHTGLAAQDQARQEQLCQSLADTARQIADDARAQATGTTAEVARLLESAAEAPRAAARVIAELREQVSAGIARDNAQLDERNRLMETLGGLLGVINHAATEQRQAIDALVASSTALLESAGERFGERVESGSARILQAGDQMSCSAAEVASLGEALGVAVRLFSDASDKLMTTLHSIEGALEKTSTRGDEQLAYYVAQAREIIDLSIMAQGRMMEDLHRATGQRAPIADET